MKIVCAGMRRSGSTWIYNTARLICVELGVARGCFEDTFDSKQLAPLQVVKTHKFLEAFLFGADRVLVTHRDLRDVAASAIRRGLLTRDIAPVIRFLLKTVWDEFDVWERYAHLSLPYAEIRGDRVAATGRVAEVLAAEVDCEKISRYVDGLPASSPPDPEILLHLDHFTDGDIGTYAKTLSPEIIVAIEAVFADWLAEHGYAADGGSG